MACCLSISDCVSDKKLLMMSVIDEQSKVTVSSSYEFDPCTDCLWLEVIPSFCIVDPLVACGFILRLGEL